MLLTRFGDDAFFLPFLCDLLVCFHDGLQVITMEKPWTVYGPTMGPPCTHHGLIMDCP